MKTKLFSLKNLLLGLFLLIITSCFNSTAQAQCTPDPFYTEAGIYPDTAEGLTPISAGVPYSQLITIIDMGSGLPFPIQVSIDSITVSMSGYSIPISAIGLSFDCSSPDSVIPATGSACILITGTPNLNLGEGDQLTLHFGLDFLNLVIPFTYEFTEPYDMDIVSGVVYNDLNGNCLQDTGEMGLSGRIVTATPGNNHTVTGPSGEYSLKVHEAGIHDFSINGQNYWLNDCPLPSGVHTIDVTTQNIIISDKNFGPRHIADVNDMQVLVTNLNFARPGFPLAYKIDVKNLGTTRIAGNLVFQHDTLLTFVDALPTEITYTGNSISWNYDTLNPEQNIAFIANFLLSQTAVLGDSIYSTATVEPIAGDTVPGDNVDVFAQIIRGSYDPNDKAVIPADLITPTQVTQGLPLDYTIRFQNTGTDTAFTVMIRDTLSTNLSIETFEMLSSSHPCQMAFNGGGALTFMFSNILLPDSNINEVASHGYVRYRIKPLSNLVLGDEIHNTASIYFDFNAPVVTNTTITPVAWKVSVEDLMGDIPMNIYPNPTLGLLNIELPFERVTGKMELLLTNLAGQTVLKSPLTGPKSTVSLDGFAPGFYTLNLYDKGELISVKKVVLSKP